MSEELKMSFLCLIKEALFWRMWWRRCFNGLGNDKISAVAAAPAKGPRVGERRKLGSSPAVLLVLLPVEKRGRLLYGGDG